MADLSALAESPLSHLTDRLPAESGASVSLREVPFVPMVSLRVTPGDEACRRVEQVLGLALPTTVGATATTGSTTALWLGPDEWLLVSATDGADGASSGPDLPVADLAAALEGARGAVVDVGANRTVLQLQGPDARRVLEKGCSTDLHPSAFPVGRAITSTLGPVPLVLWRVGDDVFRLLPRSSFADYVARWTLDAMSEYVEAG